MTSRSHHAMRQEEGHQATERCTSAREARELLEAVLESMGGGTDPEHEPGLDPHQRAKEDHLRAAIAYLKTLDNQGGYTQLVVVYIVGALALLYVWVSAG